jgi:hypothetical protein
MEEKFSHDAVFGQRFSHVLLVLLGHKMLMPLKIAV